MPKQNAVPAADHDEILKLIEDAADLTPKELEQERLAKVEEIKKPTARSNSPAGSRFPFSRWGA
jgi:hypothetical protein